MKEFGRKAGFTLIEILAVILIVGILATILIVNLGEASDATNVQMTRTWLTQLEGAINNYENEFGDYPPSSFTVEQGVPNDGMNTGVEALVCALWSDGWEAGGVLESEELGNSDGDSAPQTVSDLGRQLFEFLDKWDNPIAYFHRRDYESEERYYQTYAPESGEEVLSAPVPFKDPDTGRYFRHNKFQLISAGPDGTFGTEDDVTSFERK